MWDNYDKKKGTEKYIDEPFANEESNMRDDQIKHVLKMKQENFLLFYHC
jgi:hypothetical protein